MDQGAEGIIQYNVMTLVKNSPVINKLLNFGLKFFRTIESAAE